MSTLQRIVIFIIGALLGVMIIRPILAKRSEAKTSRNAAADKQNIPGLLLDFAQQGQPVYDEKGDGVLESVIGPGTEGFGRTRRVLTGGRPRFDEAGNALPQEFIAITEYYVAPGEPTPASRVAKYEFAFADRVLVTVKTPADTAKVHEALKSSGVRLATVPGSPGKVIVRIAKPTLAFVDATIAGLKGVPEVVSAVPVKLDWKRELIK